MQCRWGKLHGEGLVLLGGPGMSIPHTRRTEDRWWTHNSNEIVSRTDGEGNQKSGILIIIHATLAPDKGNNNARINAYYSTHRETTQLMIFHDVCYLLMRHHVINYLPVTRYVYNFLVTHHDITYLIVTYYDIYYFLVIHSVSCNF